MEEYFASIIVDISTEALNKAFVYKVPNDLIGIIKQGDKVIFPFGNWNKDKEGFVLEVLTLDRLKEKNYYKNNDYFKNDDVLSNLKVIKGIVNEKIAINQILFKIAIFLCKEYYCPIQLCLNTVLPIKKRVRKNSKQVDAITKYKINVNKKIERENIILNDEQLRIINDIEKIKDNVFNEHLIYGVTGSGKTEVYINIINDVLKEGKQVIVLIPEIALTHQTVIRLKERFSDDIAIIHSRMSDGDKYIQYKKCEDGNAHIMVGPRSAIFAPFENLGLIVIDEVNDSSYKSETSPRYNTLEVARYRAMVQNATLISLSATPNVDLYYEANKKDSKIHFHKLNYRAKSNLPKVYIVDMKEEFKSGNKSIFSNFLISKINEKLKKNEQVMIYMNRRGYNTIFTCKNCGTTYKCPHCDVALVSHFDGKLKCHYCGYEINEPITCPSCNSNQIEKYGMGTEKLEEECLDLFPNAKILRMDRDTTKEKDGYDKIIEKFGNGDADILIGTQMIIKGHDFPNVSLVAIMRADLTLYNESYKASEETFSMLTQCVGRSGRKVSGESIIQTYEPDNEILNLVKKQDYEEFYNNVISYRKKLKYPPFSKLLHIKACSSNFDYLDDMCKNIKIILDKKNNNNATILGPAKLNPEKIKDIYYRQFTVKCNNKEDAIKFRSLTQKFVNYADKFNLIKLIYDIE